MGRRIRPHSPGTIFHLVSRTHRGEGWYVPAIRAQINGLIRGMVGRTDARLVAYAVMPNHLHIVVQQGRAALETLMQPLLRRVAHRVQRHHGFEGSVVERRYRESACETPAHAREAILYTHLNPWRAGLCGDDLLYDATTQAAYAPGADPALFGIAPAFQLQVLELFASEPHQPRDRLCHDYMGWIEQRMRQDRIRSGLVEEEAWGLTPPHPPRMVGDDAWRRWFAGSLSRGPHAAPLLPDLRDFVLAQWGLLTPDLRHLQLDHFRGSWIPRRIARARSRLIRAAVDCGYRTGEVATFFDVSPQTVSRAKYAPAEV